MEALFNGKPALTPVTLVLGSIKVITNIGAVRSAIAGGIPLGDCPCAMDGARIKMVGPIINVPRGTENYVAIAIGQVMNLFNTERKATQTKQPRLAPGLKGNTNGIICARRWYFVLEALEALGYTKENIAIAFDVNTESNEYVAIDHIGYFYLIGRKYPEYVNWKSLFMKGPDPWTSVAKMLETEDMRDSPELLLEAVEFFQKLDMGRFIDNGNDAGRFRVLVETKLRANLVVDVYSIEKSYYTYPGFHPTEGVLDSRKYATAKPRLNVGDPTIHLTLLEAQKNLSIVLTNLFENSRNPKFTGEFPWTKVVLAGGLIEAVLRQPAKAISKSSDIDIFVIGEGEQMVNTLRKIFEYFDIPDEDGRPTTYFNSKGGQSVFEIRVVGHSRPIQVILSENSLNAFDVIGRFDLSNIRLCYCNGHFYGMPDAIRTLRTGVATIENTSHARTDRYAKTLYKGIDLDIRDVPIDPQAKDDLMNPNSHLCVKARQTLVGSVYEVKHDESLSPQEEIDTVIYNITKLNGNAVFYTGPNRVSEIIKIAATTEFATGYRFPSVGELVDSMYVNTVVPGQDQKIFLKSVVGLNSKPLMLKWTNVSVSSVTDNATGVTITFSMNDEMKEFVEKKVPEIWRKLNYNGKVDKITDERGNIAITINPTQLRIVAPRPGERRPKKPLIRDYEGLAVGADPDSLHAKEVTVILSILIVCEKDTSKVKMELVPKAILVPISAHIPVKGEIPSQLPVMAPPEVKYMDVL